MLSSSLDEEKTGVYDRDQELLRLPKTVAGLYFIVFACLMLSRLGLTAEYRLIHALV